MQYKKEETMLKSILEELVINASILGSTYEDSVMSEKSYEKTFSELIAHAKSEIEKLVMSEENLNLLLWRASNEWNNTHAENAEGYIRYLATAIRAEQLKRMEGR
jgi:hypothetical protein